MRYSKYNIACTFEESGTLNAFKGSALRGAFGTALKKAVCTIRNHDCSTCILQQGCLFTKLFFELQNTKETPSQRLLKPYIIEPPLEEKLSYSKGETFSFNLILLGCFHEYLPFLLYAIEIMGNQGIGRSTQNIREHASFSIKQVYAFHNDATLSIYDTEKKQLLSIPPPSLLSPPVFSTDTNIKSDPSNLKVQLLTPLRFKADNCFGGELSFEQLSRLMLRRITTLFTEFSKESFYLDYQKILEQAKQIRVIDSTISWKDYARYSSRQQQALKLGGLIGTVRYEGNIAPFIPLLDLATLLHLGKQTTFGLGKISYTLA